MTLNNTNTYSGGTLLSGLDNIATVNGAFGSGNVSLTAAGCHVDSATRRSEQRRPYGQPRRWNDFIADSATFSIGFTDDIVNLNYTGTETINMLIVNNGSPMAAGVYAVLEISLNFLAQAR